jgi:hypothetical protein
MRGAAGEIHAGNLDGWSCGPPGRSRGKRRPHASSRLQHDLINACKSRPINLVSATKARSNAVSLAAKRPKFKLCVACCSASLRYKYSLFSFCQEDDTTPCCVLGRP